MPVDVTVFRRERNGWTEDYVESAYVPNGKNGTAPNKSSTSESRGFLLNSYKFPKFNSAILHFLFYIKSTMTFA